MTEQIRLSKNGKTLRLQILRSARRTIALEVKNQERILLRIPSYLSDRELRSFLEQEKAWIFEKTEQMLKKQESRETTGAVSYESLSASEKKQIKDHFAARVAYYQQKMGVTVERITIRNQKTCWGSCSAKGNLNFNYQLYYLPGKLLDYVVVHELAHRRHMNHSAEFWQEVERYCPEYRERRRELKRYKLFETDSH